MIVTGSRTVKLENVSIEDGLYLRQTLFDKARRIVVKVGSAVLTDQNGIAEDVVQNIAREISFLHRSGREVILVSSGAVAAGIKKISYNRNSSLGIKEKQALAAIGQSSLMQTYERCFSSFDHTIAQVLLTHSDLARRNRYLNVRNTLLTLFKFHVIPVINENDTVSVQELRFGDNDTLGAYICNLIEADMFICLTDVNGLYNKDPEIHHDAEPIYTVPEITSEIDDLVHNSKSSLGTGGMKSKLKAARIVSAGGGCSFIGPGKEKEILQKLFSGQMVGTFFLPCKERIQSRKRWIATVLKPQGTLVLDAGACAALCNGGKSLLPSGIKEVHGGFGVGDAVHCCDENGTVIAVGLVNYDSEDTIKIMGKHTSTIEKLLGYKDNDEVMHRDNLVILEHH
ncbi:MAG: glutamate 5-kinase [Desulfocapsaceae bacterium]|jgi:glutamate 5-kinase|nr:glutamate 5-kinase [Desulfocapsaceae bacterium]